MTKQLSTKEAKDQRHRSEDPVLMMLGVGEQLWKDEPGDTFVERLRSEELPAPPREKRLDTTLQNVAEAVWHRIKSHEGEVFKTATSLPFTYQVDGQGMWFFRNRQRINRKLTRTQLNLAIGRCPLRSTTEIKDVMDYPYVFALLMDSRIRGQEW